MRQKHLLAPVIALLLTAGFLLSPGSAEAQSARGCVVGGFDHLSEILRSRPLVNVQFYPEGSSTAVSYNPLGGNQLQANAGASFFIGNVQGLASGFRGNAVMEQSAVRRHRCTVLAAVRFQTRLLLNGFSCSRLAINISLPPHC